MPVFRAQPSGQAGTATDAGLRRHARSRTFTARLRESLAHPRRLIPAAGSHFPRKRAIRYGAAITVGRRMKRSATSAAIIANALSQPNSRSDGRSENTVTDETAGQHHRGQDQRRADQHGRRARPPSAGILARLVSPAAAG